MDSNGGVKVRLCGAKPYGHTIALGHLSSIGAQEVEPYHTLLQGEEGRGRERRH